MEQLLRLSVVIVVVAVAARRYVQWRSRQQARETLVAFAIANGWTYLPSDSSLVSRWFLPPFGRGEQRTARHVLRGRRAGRSFVAFEYRYVEITTDSKGRQRRRTSTHSVVAVSLPGWLPTVTVEPETLTSRAMRVTGLGDDVELESEAFNRAYTVSGDARAASDLLTPRAMHSILAGPRFAWRCEGSELVSWDSSPFGPTDLLVRLATLEAVIAAAPSFLWSGGGSGPRGLPEGPPAMEGWAS